ncbi:unnamed protein product [Camellia sinensis]
MRRTGDALNALKTNLADPNNFLQNWDATQVNPCTWFNVTCNSGNSVTRVDLGNANLSGQLVPELGQLLNLQYLELFSNNISGRIPIELGNLTSLVSLDLYLNNLSGIIPDTLGRLQKLRFLSATGAIVGGVVAGAALLFLALAWPLSKMATMAESSDENPIIPPPDSAITITRSRLDRLLTIGSAHLHQTIERPDSQPPLDWLKRKQIALGSARGLACLHNHCDPKIIHRDVKVANILLNEEFEAVVGDFELAKLMDYKDTHVTTVVRVTIGHIAPEYLSTGKSSEKTNVFRYGVMLLELITGQRLLILLDLPMTTTLCCLIGFVKGLLKDRKVETLVNADMQGNYVEDEVKQLIQVALLCTLSSLMERPKISVVVRMLEGDGLAERWEEWQKEEMFWQEFVNILHQNNNWIIAQVNNLPDSTPNLPLEELSRHRRSFK